VGYTPQASRQSGCENSASAGPILAVVYRHRFDRLGGEADSVAVLIPARKEWEGCTICSYTTLLFKPHIESSIILRAALVHLVHIIETPATLPLTRMTNIRKTHAYCMNANNRQIDKLVDFTDFLGL
jgi:hypothetical protein